MSRIFFTSDTHWFHRNIIAYCGRPFDSVLEMNQHLIDEWNRVVKPNDIVYHLGDFAFAGSEKIKDILGQLNGKLSIVLGNHDQQLRKVLRQDPDLVDAYYNGVKYLNHDGRVLTLSHYPFMIWLESEKGVDRSIHLHGHQHANAYYDGRAMLDVGVDSAAKILGEYRPFSYDEVMEWISANVITEYIQTKQCLSCMLTKSVNEFHVANNNQDGYRNDCKQCRIDKKKRAVVQPPYIKCMECEIVKENIPTNFEITDPTTATKIKRRKCIECVKKYQLDIHYKNQYGLSWKDVESLKEQQQNKCAICGLERKLVVDHNHTTKKVRGMLCDKCNRGIGFMEENLETLQNAIEYLKFNH